MIISKEPFDDEIENKIVQQVMDSYGMNRAEAASIIINEEVANNAYNSAYDSINVLFKNGEVKDIADASDNLNIQTLASPVRKYFMCHPLLN